MTMTMIDAFCFFVELIKKEQCGMVENSVPRQTR